MTTTSTAVSVSLRLGLVGADACGILLECALFMNQLSHFEDISLNEYAHSKTWENTGIK